MSVFNLSPNPLEPLASSPDFLISLLDLLLLRLLHPRQCLPQVFHLHTFLDELVGPLNLLFSFLDWIFEFGRWKFRFHDPPLSQDVVAVHTAWSSPVDVVEGLMVGYVVSREPTEGGNRKLARKSHRW